MAKNLHNHFHPPFLRRRRAATLIKAALPATAALLLTANPVFASTQCGVANVEASVIAQLNKYRAAGFTCPTGKSFGPAVALTGNSKLDQAAVLHSQYMAGTNHISHTGAGGSQVNDRVEKEGYEWTAIAENVATGGGTELRSAEQAVKKWIESTTGHCDNIMTPDYLEVGVGCHQLDDKNKTNYWTINLGSTK